MFAVCLSLLVLSTPIDNAHDYFTGLSRPYAERIQIKRNGGPVILIVVDAMRPDHLSPYGYDRDTTPNLKALADDGIILTNYHVNGNWTRPSTASMLTGLPPSEHGVERDRDRLADEYVTMAELLRDVKVPTGAVVGNGNAGSAFGLSRGFDFYADTVKHWRGLPSADQVVELAIPFVRKHREQPFFLMLFFIDPHDPYHAPPPYENMYVGKDAAPLIRSPHWERFKYTKAQIERMKATYDGALRYADTAIGRFIATLKELGIYDQATIMVTADHGEAFGEHGVFLHAHHLYDEIVRAPLIIRSPIMSTRGVYHNGLFQTIDLMPSIVRYFDGKVPSQLPGADIFAHLARPRLIDAQRFVICEFHNFGIHRRMIRNYEYKIIYEEPADAKEFYATVRKRSLLPSVSFDRDKIMFFDLDRDPFEINNIYSSNNAKRQPWRGLIKLLKTHRARYHRSKATPMAERLDTNTENNLRSLGYIQ